MKRSLGLLAVGVVGAFAILYAVRVSQKSSTAALASLLPRDTIAFAHMPDFGRSRDEWHRSDIYQLYTEPAMQEFLRKPLTQLPQSNSFSQRLHDVDQLDPKDAFIAVVGTEKDDPKLIGGFRFRGNQETAEQIIATWRDEIDGDATKRETIEYQQHQIDIYGTAPFSVANVYDRDWFFVSNDENAIKALLDRADGRNADPQSLLSADDGFRAASKQVPANYALGFYAQPKRFADKMSILRGNMGQQMGPDQQTVLDQIRTVYATTRFDNGKIHDVIFVGTPPSNQGGTLTRESLGLTTPDTFLYIAGLLNASQHLALLNSANSTGNGFVGLGLGKIATALARAKIDMSDWQSAFGDEAGLVADWPNDAHWPSGVVAFTVKDFERAKKLAAALAHASDEDAAWRESDRGGVHYITMQSAPGFLVLKPTIAVSNRVMAIGLDPRSVEAAIERGDHPTAGLGQSGPYKIATASLPQPTNFFAYVDLARLYTRFDETVRPILTMWAAFMPGVNDQIDLNRIPAPEVITRHLSPIVSSQRYIADGYIAESIGPITLNQAGLALLAAGTFGFRGQGFPNVLGGFGGSSPSLKARPGRSLPLPTPAASP